MMRKTIITGITAVMLFALMSVTVMAAKVDFSGTWVLDHSKSEGVPPGLNQTMTIKQSDDRLDIDLKISMNGKDEEVKDVYILDGKETEFTPMGPGGAGKGKRTSKWSKDGNAVDVVEKATMQGPDGAIDVKITRHLEVSADGKTLTIERISVGPRGERKSKQVYVKK